MRESILTHLFTPSSESREHPAVVAVEAGSHGKSCLNLGLIIDNPPALEGLFKPKAPASVEICWAYVQAL